MKAKWSSVVFVCEWEEMKKAKRASVCVCGTVGGGDEEG